MSLQRANKKRKGKCSVKYCRNDAAKGRRICHKCHQREFRLKHPFKAAYARLRDRASTRNINFSLSYDHFVTVAIEGKLIKEGVRDSFLHVDRINPNKGYEDGNIQILTYSENIAKGNRERHAPDYYNRRKQYYDTRAEEEDDGNPF